MDSDDRDYEPAMRPTGFANDMPEDITPPGADFTLRRFTLLCEDGEERRATVLISRGAEYQAHAYPEVCHPEVARAVSTEGRSVLESRVFDHDDPHLDWRVDTDGFRRVEADQ
jgi:hypothetical protein